jgi:hypothetical protein
LIGGHPVHAGARQARTAEDVPAAQDHGDLHTHLHQITNLAGDAL